MTLLAAVGSIPTAARSCRRADDIRSWMPAPVTAADREVRRTPGVGRPRCWRSGAAGTGGAPALDAWRRGCNPRRLHDRGRASASASTAVPAACFRARLAREAEPGRGTHRPGPCRLAADRRARTAEDRRGRSGRRTWRPSLATCHPPRASRPARSPSNVVGSMPIPEVLCAAGAARVAGRPRS